MTRHHCIASMVLCFVVAGSAFEQTASAQIQGALDGGGLGGMGGGGFSGDFQPSSPLEIIEPNTATAQLARASLDLVVELGQIKTKLGELDDLLTQRLEEVPVFVDPRGIKFAELTAETAIEAKLSKMPLRSALRRLLRPHSLRVVVEEEGLVITADFTELARRGIATDVWVDQDIAAQARIRKALEERLSVDLRDVRLDKAVSQIGAAAGIPIVVDRRALEDAAVQMNDTIGLRIKNATLRMVLKLVLRDDGLSYRVNNEVLEITTSEAAAQTLVNRIYFLEATGFVIGDSDGVSMLIQTSINPETWEEMGGPSIISVVSHGRQSRPALLVSTTLDVHEKIEALLRVMRESHVGADPKQGPGIRNPEIPARPVLGIREVG